MCGVRPALRPSSRRTRIAMWVTVAIVALSTLNSSDLINFLQGKQRSRVLPGPGSRSLLGRGLPGPGRGRGRDRVATGVAIGPRPRPGPQPGSCRDLGSPQPGCDWKVAATRPALGPQPGCDWPAAGPRPVKGRSGPGLSVAAGLSFSIGQSFGNLTYKVCGISRFAFRTTFA